MSNQKSDGLSSTTQQALSEKLTDSQLRRLKVQRDTLEMEWDLRQSKLKQLRKDSAIEASATVRFQLQHQIEAAETELSQLNDELDKIEQILHHGEVIATSQSFFEVKRDTIREQFDRSTPQTISSQTAQQHLEAQSLARKDEIILVLINKLFDALYSPNVEVGIQKFEAITHKSLFQNGQFDPAFRKNNFSVAFTRKNLYKRPIEIIDSQPTGRTRLGLRADKEDGKEEKYEIARNDNFKGLYHVRIFFPADDKAAKISGLSL